MLFGQLIEYNKIIVFFRKNPEYVAGGLFFVL